MTLLVAVTVISPLQQIFPLNLCPSLLELGMTIAVLSVTNYFQKIVDIDHQSMLCKKIASNPAHQKNWIHIILLLSVNTDLVNLFYLPRAIATGNKITSNNHQRTLQFKSCVQERDRTYLTSDFFIDRNLLEEYGVRVWNIWDECGRPSQTLLQAADSCLCSID